MSTDFVSYTRVSTQQQGRSGLGLEAQRVAVELHVAARGRLIGEFVEIETGKGPNALEKRPNLKAALDLCRQRCATLVIAKLDRLARNVHFVSGLIESGVDFVAADMPEANKVMIQMYAVMSEWERDQISARTRAALAAAKARGVKLGRVGAVNLRPNIQQRRELAQAFADRLSAMFSDMRSRGLSQRGMTSELNEIGVPAPGGGRWSLIQVQRVMARQSVS
jgi:DNA invertase Pin-like site-specific DNA recombinase